MARGRRPTSTEPSRGTLASRAFRDRRKQEKLDLEKEVSRLQKIVESLEEENEALRSGSDRRPSSLASSPTSSFTSSNKKRRASVVSSSSSSQLKKYICSSCGGVAKSDHDEEFTEPSADQFTSRPSIAKSSKSKTKGGRSASRSTFSDGTTSGASPTDRDDSTSLKPNTSAAIEVKSEGLGEVSNGSSLPLSTGLTPRGENGFQPHLWNPPQIGFPFNNNTTGSSNESNALQRPHTSAGFPQQGGLVNQPSLMEPSLLARMSQGQLLHNPFFENPAFQFYVDPNSDSSRPNNRRHDQEFNSSGQPIQTHQLLSGGEPIHPSASHHHQQQQRLLSLNLNRKLGTTDSNPLVSDSTTSRLNEQEIERGNTPYSQIGVNIPRFSNTSHARSNSVGGMEPVVTNSLCNNASGALDSNSCCWGLLNCGDERSSNLFKDSILPFPRLQ